jgi:hypothetical protein
MCDDLSARREKVIDEIRFQWKGGKFHPAGTPWANGWWMPSGSIRSQALCLSVISPRAPMAISQESALFHVYKHWSSRHRR